MQVYAHLVRFKKTNHVIVEKTKERPVAVTASKFKLENMLETIAVKRNAIRKF